MRSFLVRLVALLTSGALVACGGSSSSDAADGEVVLMSLVARTILSWQSAAASDGTIWFVWTDQQADLTGSVNALRVRPDGRQDRWVLASSDGRYSAVKLVVVDDRPLIGWYQQLSGNLYGLRVVSWQGTGWQDEFAVSRDSVTAYFQLRAAPDGATWLLVNEILPLDGGAGCSVVRRLSPGVWSRPIDVVTPAPGSGSLCAIAPGRGGELMAVWGGRNTASTARPDNLSAAYLPAGAQRFDAPSIAMQGPSNVESLESVGTGRWALLSYTVDTTRNELAFSVRQYRNGQWSSAIHPIAVPGEVIYSLVAVANGPFVDIAWTARRADGLSFAMAPRAARFDATADALRAAQSLGPFNPDQLIGYSVSAAADGRVAAGFGTGSGPGESWLALADERGLWRPAFRFDRSQPGGDAPTALPLPDGSWAAVWLASNRVTGSLDVLMRRFQ